jgi:hypothetical protein
MTTPGARANAAPPVPGVVIRSIRPDDATCLRDFQARLSDDTIRNRFFRLHRALPDAGVHRFTSPTPGNIYTRQDGPVVHLVMGVVPAENRLALVADPAERSRAERRGRAVEVGR